LLEHCFQSTNVQNSVTIHRDSIQKHHTISITARGGSILPS